MKKLLSLSGTFLIVSLFISTSALGAVFVKFDGVEGGSDDGKHAKWSDVLDLRHGYQLQNRPRKQQDKIVTHLSIAKEFDKASIALAEALLTGRTFGLVVIEVTATYGGERDTYLKYQLSNVVVTSYQVNASGNDEDGPASEEVGLDYDGITVTYTEYDSKGSEKGDTSYTYDF